MKKTFCRRFCLCVALMCVGLALPLGRLQAQKYLVDALGRDHTVATNDKYFYIKDPLMMAPRTDVVRVAIPDSSEVQLVSVCGPIAETKNKLVAVEIRYQGQTLYVNGRDLVFSPANKPGTVDKLKDIDFSPGTLKFSYNDPQGQEVTALYNRMDVHGEEAHRLYSWAYPYLALVLMGVVWLFLLLSRLTRRCRPVKSVMMLVVALALTALTALECYLYIRLRGDVTWWINPDVFPKTVCVLRSIPLVAFAVVQVLAIFVYSNLSTPRHADLVNPAPALVGLLLCSVPAIIAGMFIASGVTGVSIKEPVIESVEQLPLILKWWGGSAAALILLYPLIKYLKDLRWLGIPALVFMMVYWLGTLSLALALVSALLKIVWAIVLQIVSWIAIGAVVMGATKMSGSGKGGGGSSFAAPEQPKTVWLDAEGGQHVSELDARMTNERIAARKAEKE